MFFADSLGNGTEATVITALSCWSCHDSTVTVLEMVFPFQIRKHGYMYSVTQHVMDRASGCDYADACGVLMRLGSAGSC
jgi:hypothetical protein